MLAAKTELRHIERVKQFLIKNNLLHQSLLPVKEFGFFYFPLQKRVQVPMATILSVKFDFPQKEKAKTIEDMLKEKLSLEELKILPRSQEVVGNILILEIPEELRKKEKIIAEAYLASNKRLETVVKKEQMHEGVYRTRKVKILAGKMSKETIHLENGVRLKLHLEKTYFSTRSGGERLRIARMVKKGENVLVMFSGAGPYPLVLAKNSPALHIWGIEINPVAHALAVENASLNNLEKKITLYDGDVRETLPQIKKKFERIIMPLPKTSEDFLGLALSKIKPKGTIHLYSFLMENEFKDYELKIKELCKAEKHKIKILRMVKCGQFSPSKFRVCWDLKVEK